MEQRTHGRVSRTLVGAPVEIGEGRATVELVTTKEMAADERGLVHGSFPFGTADYAAMLAVNDPNVVLGSATARFLQPVVAGETIRAEAVLLSSEGKKRMVKVTVTRGGAAVLECELACFVLPKHVLEKS